MEKKGIEADLNVVVQQKPFPLKLHPWHVIVRILWPFDFCQAIVIVASSETIQLFKSLSYTFQVHSQQEKIGPFSDKRSVGVQLRCIIYCNFLVNLFQVIANIY